MKKSSPEKYITLDQFKVLASRIKAKENFLQDSLQKLLIGDTLDSTQCSLRLRDKLCSLYEAMKKPADFYTLCSDVDMSNPSVVMPSQLDFFGEEFC